MSFALTASRLRNLAAAESYARGERYWRQGRVISCEALGDHIQGVVHGSQRYAVRLYEENRRIVSDCTCPVSISMCKHAVALALAHLAEGSGKTPAVRSSKSAFATQHALEAWASEHRVAHELDVSAQALAAELEGYDSGSLYWLSRWSLRDVGSIEGARGYVTARLVERLADAAADRLRAAAKDVLVGIEEETRERPTPEPALIPLWTRLLDVRKVIRDRAVPRSRATRALGTLVFDENNLALRWQEPITLVVRGGPFSYTPLVTRVAFEPAVTIGCTCTAQGCTHVLALLDAALDLLEDPARATEARRIAEELLRPPWQRALAELVVEESAPQRIELWWVIDHEHGTARLAPVVKKERKKGGLTSGARVPPARLLEEFGGALGEQDREVAEQLVAFAQSQSPLFLARAFRALVGHPRVSTADDTSRTISVHREKLGFVAKPTGVHIRIEPTIGTMPVDPHDFGSLLDGHDPIVVLDAEEERRRCVLVDVSEDARRLWAVLAKHGNAFPPESHETLLDRLARLEGRVPLAVPEALMGTLLEEPATVVVRLRLTPEAALELEPWIRPARGAPLFPPGVGPRAIMISRDGRRAHVKRDLGHERELVAAMLARLPLETATEGPPGCFHLDDADAALALVAAVQEPPPGLEAEWIDRRPVLVRSGGPAGLNVKIERKRDWFGVVGDFELDHGRVELAVLLDAARRQRKYVRLDDGRWLELSEQLCERLTQLADRTFETKHHIELSPAAVPAIRELERAGAKLEAPPAWQLMSDRLLAASQLEPEPPAKLVATLRPYQREGFSWLSRLAAWGAGACLADDMGLGKTVQAIAVLLDRAQRGPALVLAPTSVTLNWIDELRRFAPSLRPILYGEQTDRAACIAKLGKRDILIASYGLLVRDADALASRSFATLVIDEAQALKNAATRRAKAARALDAEFRVALSGTPLENHLGELWSLFAIVFPGLLGSWDQFRARFALPIERDRDPVARAALSRVIRPFLLRRTKQEVATELPARTEIQLPIALSAEETALYDDARLAILAKLKGRRQREEDEERRRFEVLAALTRLRLLASHPKLYDPDSAVASSKMQRLLELLDELRSEGHRALVFSQFTSHLGLVRDALDKAGIASLYLDGATPAAMRAELIRRFQAGEGEVFLLSLKAGGTGINLTAADYVIHLDPWWNPAVEDQATDRAHRIGQTKPVTVYRLIARGTIEEQILSLHGDKRALVAGVLEGTDVAARLTTRDLLALLDA